jgi:SOS response regulatory protein OraA/RecX
VSGAQRIEETRADPRDPGLLRIRVGERWLDPIRRETAMSLRLSEGRRWTKTLASRVQAEIDAVACRAEAMRRLGARDLTCAALQARLTRRWGEAIADRTVQDLAASGWLDDQAFAARRAGQLQLRSPLSADLLQARLEHEGVPERDARRAAEAAQDHRALHRQVLVWKREGRAGNWMARRLGRQGFDADTIKAALHRARVPCDLEP